MKLNNGFMRPTRKKKGEHNSTNSKLFKLNVNTFMNTDFQFVIAATREALTREVENSQSTIFI